MRGAVGKCTLVTHCKTILTTKSFVIYHRHTDRYNHALILLHSETGGHFSHQPSLKYTGIIYYSVPHISRSLNQTWKHQRLPNSRSDNFWVNNFSEMLKMAKRKPSNSSMIMLTGEFITHYEKCPFNSLTYLLSQPKRRSFVFIFMSSILSVCF